MVSRLESIGQSYEFFNRPVEILDPHRAETKKPIVVIGGAFGVCRTGASSSGIPPDGPFAPHALHRALMSLVVDDDLAGLDQAELDRRIDDIRQRMRPAEEALSALRAERDVLLTERRRRERAVSRTARAGLKAAMKGGALPTIAELVASGETGPLDRFTYNLKTGGEVLLGYPGARAQSLAFTDGARVAQAADLERAAELYAAGWELGAPGRPGVRVHFPGTKQERLVGEDEVHARPREAPGG
jgi:hypothetical protein